MGLTETPSVVSHKIFRPPYLDSWKSSGQLIPAYQIEIVDEQGRKLGPRQEGEIVVRGESLGRYRGQDREDLRTGDFGFLDEADELFIVGRKSSYLKHRGFRLSPELIESVVGLVEGVHDCRALTVDAKLIVEVRAQRRAYCARSYELH
jgi:acyl-CoA synthetase (AMP-forming)/AMP-acid ligase II